MDDCGIEMVGAEMDHELSMFAGKVNRFQAQSFTYLLLVSDRGAETPGVVAGYAQLPQAAGGSIWVSECI
jgi:hypothetical protein